MPHPTGSRQIVGTASTGQRTATVLLSALALAGCQAINETASKAAEDFQGGMQRAYEGNEALKAGNAYTVRGRVTLRDGQTLTCFDGIPAGYVGRSDLAAPAESVADPRTGRLIVRTAAIPATILTRSGTFASNQCDQLAADGVLETTATSAPAVRLASKLPPKTACRDVPPALQPQHRLCVSFDPADHCSVLPIDGSIPNGKSDLTAICDARKTQALFEQEAAFQKQQASKRKP